MRCSTRFCYGRIVSQIRRRRELMELPTQYLSHPADQRWFSESSASKGTPSVNGPRRPRTTTWERGAIAVKDSNYPDAIRQTHDPSHHIKSEETIVKQTIGPAIGKQRRKFHWAVGEMEQEYQTFVHLADQYDAAVAHAKAHPTAVPLLTKAQRKTLYHTTIRKHAFRHNRWRVRALNARWEMTVLQQQTAAGQPQHAILQAYPIPDAILLREDREKLRKSTRRRLPPSKHWWERMNYWDYLSQEGCDASLWDKEEDASTKGSNSRR